MRLAAPIETGDAPGPSLTMRFNAPNGRPYKVSLRSLRSAALADQIAWVIWEAHRSKLLKLNASKCRLVERALCDLDDVLADRGSDDTVTDLSQITVEILDAVEHRAARQLKDPRNTRMLQAKLSVLISIFEAGAELGLVLAAGMDRRLATTLRWHRKPPRTRPRDSYSPKTMALIEAAAQSDVEDVIRRMRTTFRILRVGPRNGLETEIARLWSIAPSELIGNQLPPSPRRIQAAHLSSTVMDHVHLPGKGSAAFLILLMIATDLPPECVRELTASCLLQPMSREKTQRLKYVKRRSGTGELPRYQPVQQTGRYSAGWLVRRLLRATLPARRQLGFREDEGPLFIRQHHRKLLAFPCTHKGIQFFLQRHPEIVDDEGYPLKTLSVARIRKSVKAAKWIECDGTIAAMPKDHLPQTIYRNYLSIPSLVPLHREVIRHAGEDILELAISTRKGDLSGSAKNQDILVPPGLPVTVLRPASATSDKRGDVGIACLNPWDSPYHKPGDRCHSELVHCLNCRNAVFAPRFRTYALALMAELVELSAQIGVERWNEHFGLLAVRVEQVLCQIADV